jgi:hypothetical protein
VNYTEKEANTIEQRSKGFLERKAENRNEEESNTMDKYKPWVDNQHLVRKENQKQTVRNELL